MQARRRKSNRTPLQVRNAPFCRNGRDGENRGRCGKNVLFLTLRKTNIVPLLVSARDRVAVFPPLLRNSMRDSLSRMLSLAEAVDPAQVVKIARLLWLAGR